MRHASLFDDFLDDIMMTRVPGLEGRRGRGKRRTLETVYITVISRGDIGTNCISSRGLIGVVPSAPAPEDTWASGTALPSPIAVDTMPCCVPVKWTLVAMAAAAPVVAVVAAAPGAEGMLLTPRTAQTRSNHSWVATPVTLSTVVP